MRNIDLLTFRALWQCITAWLAVNECLGNSAEQLVGFLKFEILTLMFLACQFTSFCLDQPFSSTFVLLSSRVFSSSVCAKRALASVELRWPPPGLRWAGVWWDQTSVCVCDGGRFSEHGTSHCCLGVCRLIRTVTLYEMGMTIGFTHKARHKNI